MSAPGRRRRLTALALAGAALVACSLDLARPPERQWTARLELAAIARYQRSVSPWLGRAGARCRFTPSCSRYAAAVIRADGALVGTARVLTRLARCGPWTPAGTLDPP